MRDPDAQVDILAAWSPFLYLGQRLRTPLHNHWVGEWMASTYTVLHVISGTLIPSHRTRRWTMRAGDTGIFDPGTCLELTAGTQLIRLAFDLHVRERQVVSGRVHPANDRPQPALRTISRNDPAGILADADGSWASWCRRLAHLRLRDPAAVALANAELGKHMAELIFGPTLAEPDAETAHTFAGRVRQELIRRANEAVTVADIAAGLKLDPDHLRRRYKQETGTSPGADLRSIRLERAAALLRTTDYPLQKVAIRSGWRSPHTLRSAFCQAYGCAPMAWRRRMQ